MADMQISIRTTIHDLRRFAPGVGTEGVLGRDNVEGARMLYTSDKCEVTGLKNFFDVLDGRKAAAREAINLVMLRVDGNVSPNDLVDGKIC